MNNVASGANAVVTGGADNVASGVYATIAGGGAHLASGESATIGGGYNNEVLGNYATVAGGGGNAANGMFATVAGGSNNTATAAGAMVPGGTLNFAGGMDSFAAGNNARTLHLGSFIWADRSDTFGIPLSSTGDNQFIVRAQGGIWLGTTGFPTFTAGRFINTSTGAYLTAGGDWVSVSDRHQKEHVEAIDGARLLDSLARLPITSWSYKKAPGVRHIGPMAQDFQAAFNVGDSDTAISTIDPAGIALATIQELHRRLEAQTSAFTAAQAQAAAQDARLATQDAQIAALQAMVRELQHAMSSRSTAGGR